MQTDNQLAKQSEVRAASFTSVTKVTKQVALIIDLIKRSIDNQSPITKDDIMDTYVQWRRSQRWHRGFWKSGVWDSVNRRSCRVQVTLEEWKLTDACRNNARQWFKNNLASAIIQGKLLVIPVIEIE